MERGGHRMNIQLPVYFTAAAGLQERAGVRATVRQVLFAPELDAPLERPYPFIYTIQICNESPQAVTIAARKWVVTEMATGQVQVVEGDGVVGLRPRIEPGQIFEYQSCHAVAGNSRAEGSYLGWDDSRRPVLVRIPAFALTPPHRDGMVP